QAEDGIRDFHVTGVQTCALPISEEPEDYVHRIGRTGRAGKTGTSISFACEDDAFRLEPLQTLLGKEIKCEQPPAQLLLPTPDLPRAPRRPRPEDGSRNRSRSSGSRSRCHRGGSCWFAKADELELMPEMQWLHPQ